MPLIPGPQFINDSTPFVIARATTLPGSPTDGLMAILVDDLTTPTYEFLFRYNAAGGTYKWECIGQGIPLASDVPDSDTCSSGTYVDLAHAGPTVTLPLAGEWQLSYGTNIKLVPGSGFRANMSPKIGAAATSDGDAVWYAGPAGGGSAEEVSVSRTTNQTITAAATVILLQYKRAAVDPVFDGRWLRAIPRKVAA